MKNTETEAPNPYRWFLHILAILYFTMGFAVRFAWPPLIPLAAPDLGIGMSGAGAYMSAFYIGYVLSQIPGGLLGDRFGVRLVISLALLIEAAGTFGVGIAPDFATGFSCRIITGLGAGAVYSACVRYVGRLFPPKELGLAFGLLTMAPAGVGVIIPNLLMPWLIRLTDWRGVFQAFSLLALLAGALAFVFVRDAPSRSAGGAGFVRGLATVLKKRDLILLALSGFWIMWIMVCFVSWGNTHIKELGFGLESGNLVLTVFGLAGVAASPLGGLLTQKFSSPKLLLGLLFAGLAPCLLLFGHSSGLVGLCVFSALVGFLLGLANPILPFLTARFAGKELMATAGGVTGCIFQMGAIAGPWLTGLSKDFTGSFGVTWALLAGASICGILCLLPMSRRSEASGSAVLSGGASTATPAAGRAADAGNGAAV